MKHKKTDSYREKNAPETKHTDTSSPEDQILHEIKASAQDILPPKSLNPDAIRKTLNPDTKQHIHHTFQRFYAIAAVLAIAVICGIAGISRISPDSRTASSQNHNQADLASSGREDLSRETDDDMAPFPGEASYESIYQSLQTLAGESVSNHLADGAAGSSGLPWEKHALLENAMEEKAAETDESSSFSETNLQESGVDEADIIKTDGTFFYILNEDGTIYLVKENQGNPILSGKITPEQSSETPVELYADGNLLSVITCGSDTSLTTQDSQVYEPSTNFYTKLYTYDISNRSAPRLLGAIKQQGTYVSSRKNGSIVYLFTQYMPRIRQILTDQPKSFIPSVNDELLTADNICVPEITEQASYLVISSVDTRHPDQTLDEKAIVSASENLYVSKEYIYIYNTSREGMKTQTQILKFQYKNGRISSVNAATLPGYLINSFALQEYNGCLRLVLTEDGNQPKNALYVLDENMDVCGSVKNLAPGETIQSARFLKDTGYFVTFRQTDPLFSVDLKDPSDPQILGELKITGFSSYLHFWDPDTLLGVGYEADPETGQTTGIKLSMFDISDPANVKEVDKYVMKDHWDCSLLMDYKSVMIDPAKNLFGFTCDGNYLIFTYSASDGFRQVFSQKLPNHTSDEIAMEDTVSFGSTASTSRYARGFYVDHIFYLIWDQTIQSFDISRNFEKISSLKLTNS